MHRRLFWGLIVTVMIAGLAAGSGISRAQEVPDLSEAYIWQPYGLYIRYPEGWILAISENHVSIHPADRDVSDGMGPELVLWALPNTGADQLDDLIRSLAAAAGGSEGSIVSVEIEGRPARSFVFDRTEPDTMGGVSLIAVADQTVLGVAYTVRDSEADQLLPILEAIRASVTFKLPSGSSITVASVQLPQRYEWNDAGLVFYFPEGWTIEEGTAGDTRSLTVLPSMGGPGALVDISLIPGFSGVNLRQVVQDVTGEQLIGDVVDVTIAGYPGVAYEVRDETGEPTLRLRGAVFTQENNVVLLLFGADEKDWQDFRPLVEAIIGSIERLDNTTSSRLPVYPVHAQARLFRTPLPVPQDQQTYVWDDFGFTFTLPQDWQVIAGNGQDFDLALLSPEAVQTQTSGAAIVFQHFSSLGPDATPEGILQGVIDQNQINATVEPFTVSGVTGAGAVQTNDQTGEVQRMVLIPYGPLGEAFFIVAFGNAADDQTLQYILNTMVIKRPTPDYAAIDAAWQTSLAEKGSLIYGSPDAPIKLVEYLDFSCSHCADYSTDMDRLIALEVETGHLQVEYKLLDVIGVEYSDRATTAAYCAAAQGKGYVVYETLFRSSRELGPQDAYSAENIKSLLEKPEIGLDMDAWEACINSDTYGDLIAQNDISAQGAGVTGTPAILVGTDAGNLAFMTAPDGSTWTGGIPLPMLRTAIHRAIDDGVSIASVFAPTPTGNQ